MWVWYCDSCDEEGEPVETRDLAVEGADVHRLEPDPDGHCCLVVCPQDLVGDTVLAAMVGAGKV